MYMRVRLCKYQVQRSLIKISGLAIRMTFLYQWLPRTKYGSSRLLPVNSFRFSSKPPIYFGRTERTGDFGSRAGVATGIPVGLTHTAIRAGGFCPASPALAVRSKW